MTKYQNSFGGQMVPMLSTAPVAAGDSPLDMLSMLASKIAGSAAQQLDSPGKHPLPPAPCPPPAPYLCPRMR